MFYYCILCSLMRYIRDAKGNYKKHLLTHGLVGESLAELGNTSPGIRHKLIINAREGTETL